MFAARKTEKFKAKITNAEAAAVMQKIIDHDDFYSQTNLDSVLKMLTMTPPAHRTVRELHIHWKSTFQEVFKTCPKDGMYSKLHAQLKRLDAFFDACFEWTPWSFGTVIEVPVPTAPAAASSNTDWRAAMTKDVRNAIVATIVKTARGSKGYASLKDDDLLAMAKDCETRKFNSSSSRESYETRIKKALQNMTSERESGKAPASSGKEPAASSGKEPAASGAVPQRPTRPTLLGTAPKPKPKAPAPHPAKPSGPTGDQPAWAFPAARGIAPPGVMHFGNAINWPTVSYDAGGPDKPLSTLLCAAFTESNTTWTKSMFFDPSKAFPRPGRDVVATERMAHINLLPFVGQTTYKVMGYYRPVLLAHLNPGGVNPANNALVAMIYNDGRVPDGQIVFEYEGDDAGARAVATLGALTPAKPGHACRMHPHIGPMLWSATKLFDNFTAKELAAVGDLKSFRRFIVLVLPRAELGVEKDYDELASKNPESDDNALNGKLSGRVEKGDSFPFVHNPPVRIPGKLVKRSDFYAAGMQLCRKNKESSKDYVMLKALITGISTGRAVKPVRQSAAAADEEEEEVVQKRPESSGKRTREPIEAEDEAPAVDYSDSEPDDEDRGVHVKSRKAKPIAPPVKKARVASDDDEAGEEEEEDEKASEEEESDEEEELSADEDDDDDEEEEEDEEDAMEVEAAPHASGIAGDVEPLKKKKAVATSSAAAPPSAPKAKKAPAPAPAAASGKAPMAAQPRDDSDDDVTVSAMAKKLAPTTSSVSAPKPAKATAAPKFVAPTADTPHIDFGFTSEQMESVYNATGGGRDHAATERRRLAVAAKTTKQSFYDMCGIGARTSTPLHPGLAKMPKTTARILEAGSFSQNSMTALALDGEKANYNRAVEALLKYNKELCSTVYHLANRLDAAELRSSSRVEASNPGVQKAVSVTSHNLIKFTPQVARLGQELAKVSGDFNSILAAMNAQAAGLAEAIEEANAPQNGRK